MSSFKLVSFESGDGARAGMVVDDRVSDIAALTGMPGHETVLGVLADWPAAEGRLRRAAESAAATGVPLAQVKLLAPIPRPGAIYCAGANYADHALEMAKLHNRPIEPDPHTLGLKPWHFIKVSHAVAAPDDVVDITAASKTMDWEVELAAVIGRPAKNVSIERALDYVAGYTIANDLSARDMGNREKISVGSPFKADWVSHKSFDGSCPMGPWIVPASDIGDPHNLAMKLWVNDVIKQDSNSGQMIFNTNEQIAQLSSRITLHPGDVIMTGTPAGVGAARKEFLKAGDTVKLWIEKIGTLSNKMK
ncbi:MAG TPA: fumarylacetoacetate hydrolase family protein [Xanthobacteraceae bacterium]|jgi:2-keto-4-pentenoate hydratase/2-oxohepta-3-ene-1,7-dioic acid hydratase in catechol pathway